MTITVGDSLIPTLKEYGVNDIDSCYNCGGCTAVCNLSGEEAMFPRRVIRLVQLGAVDRLKQDSQAWNCFYCGECSTSCPRGAEPAELMMGIRRYLTASYDRTGRSKRLYTSTRASMISAMIWFVLPIFMMIGIHVFKDIGFLANYNIDIITTEVALNRFAPVELINIVAHLYGIFLGIFMIMSMLTMWSNVMSDPSIEGKITIGDYISTAFSMAFDILTIKKWSECDSDQRARKRKHWILLISYLGMFVIIVGFLTWFQTDNIYGIENPQRWLPYLFTIGLLYGSIEPILKRRKQSNEQMHKFSHHTDWMLPLSIMMVSITGILVHIGRYAPIWFGIGIATAAWFVYVIYVIHLGFTSLMLSTEVGIGKWAHIFLRPLGMYLEGVKQRVVNKK